MRFLGLADLEELEDLVADHDLPVRLYADGSILQVGRDGPDAWAEALFERHRRVVGHRPDDPEEVERAAGKRRAAEDAERAENDKHAKRLKERVRGRRSRVERSTS